MTNAILNILFFLASIVFCVQAKDGFDATLCQTIAWCFLAQNVCYFAFSKKKFWLGFEFFFAIAFFFVNLAYPNFYFHDNPRFSIFWMDWNHLVITRATAIAYLGYTAYMLGLTTFGSHPQYDDPVKPAFEFTTKHYLLLFAFTMGAFVLYIVSGGYAVLQGVYSGGENIRAVGLYSYFYVLFVLGANLLAIFIYRIEKQSWWFYMLVLLCIMVLILTTGSRSAVLGWMLILLVGFNNNFRQFRVWEMLVLTFSGVLVLYLIMQTREQQMAPSAIMQALRTIKPTNVTDMFYDLIMNNRNLYVQVDYADHHGYSYFMGMLVDLCSPIPGATRWLSRWTGMSEVQMSAQDFTSYLRFGENIVWGLGSNMVGDAFRAFGYVGTVISMYLVGSVVKNTYYHSHHNIYVYTIYYLFVGYSIFYTRAPIIFPLRNLVWSLLLIALLAPIENEWLIGWYYKVKAWVDGANGAEQMTKDENE